jgi:hypothetical protein
MRKLLILPIMFMCMMFAAFAYSVIDYDEITYTGDKSTLLLYGWRNSTTADGLSYCQASIFGELYCADPSGFGRGVHHLFNNVSTSYCPTQNYTAIGNASNITQRFNFKLAYSPPVNEVQQFGLSENLMSTPPSDMKVYVYDNLSGNTKICLKSGASEVCPYSQPANTNLHSVQVDYVFGDVAGGLKRIINATLWADGNSSSLTNSGSSTYNCMNSTMYYFRKGIWVYNLTVIHYNKTDSFVAWNASVLGGIPAATQCNDGIDNDADGFTDLLDPSCADIFGTTELPVDTTQCNDGEDNDGDGLIDYPNDPSCTGFSDNSEAPFDSFQCNDGRDNDGDGLIDFPNDPSCTSPSGSTESPAQSTILVDDLCSISESCIIKTTFPYSDSVYFHGWANRTGEGLSNIAFLPDLANRGLLINNYGLYSFNADLEKNFTNPMSFDYVEGKISIQLKYNLCPLCSDEHILFFALQDNTGKNAILFEFDVNTSVAYQMPVNLYLINSTGGKQFVNSYNLNSFNYFTEIPFVLFNSNNSISIGSQTLAFSNQTTPSKARIYVNPIKFDSRKLGFYFTDIQLTGKISTDSICTNYAPPYYLKEDFNYGYLSQCAWAVNPDLLVNGELQVESTLDYYYAVKSMYDTKAQTFVKLNNRFTTITFDYTPKSTGSSDSALSLFVYDYPTTNIVASFSFDKDGDVYSNPNGDPQILTTITPDSTAHIKIVFDLSQDTFKFYVNDGIIATSVKLQNTDYDYQDIYSVYLTSSYSEYDLDSLYVFTSDAVGSPLLSLGNVNVKPVDNQTYLWGILYKATPACVQDSDCPSGQCAGYKKCASLNYKLCDEYGYNRTNWCFFKLMVAKSLDWVVNMIIDNFLLFLGLLILLMFFLFLWGHLRRR